MNNILGNSCLSYQALGRLCENTLIPHPEILTIDHSPTYQILSMTLSAFWTLYSIRDMEYPFVPAFEMNLAFRIAGNTALIRSFFSVTLLQFTLASLMRDASPRFGDAPFFLAFHVAGIALAESVSIILTFLRILSQRLPPRE